jgi:hypothetical protein
MRRGGKQISIRPDCDLISAADRRGGATSAATSLPFVGGPRLRDSWRYRGVLRNNLGSAAEPLDKMIAYTHRRFRRRQPALHVHAPPADGAGHTASLGDDKGLGASRNPAPCRPCEAITYPPPT